MKNPDTTQSAYTSKMAAGERFLDVMRELVYTYQAITSNAAKHIAAFDLTPAQFDIIATLGNTNGMTFKELGEKTLITKGTLTGVIDRLEQKGLVKRIAGTADRRTLYAVLTPEGEAVFEKAFPAHIAYIKQFFEKQTCAEQQILIQHLKQLRTFFVD
ncbi:MarR family winged helix-turn-helix transcriptional regulator [Beggiatoa leptomitoformis]|uniref:MarR family transcriptional regulator n=1 Tax=Beggiatoa leptomitoformis TaxID=288004 RepID=A0A2N9YGS7_9GAMM|nr:MarR family transcriptional regulator [Beggiatoa leptomitoformis]ALG68005.1 MarR family transcriptional regulator [Beggiatoa leptomitoformis]AUI69710.1 MarR family transcriptional regulator [Beggiatoa leptomitoformis]